MPVWYYSNPPELPPLSLRDLGPVDKCIYCESAENLSTEHVVPAGMRGRVTLARATCESCRKSTHEIETKCMRDTLLGVRIKHALHQHPLERPATHPVEFTDWEDNKTVCEIPLAECPIVTVMPVFEWPGILRRVRPEDTTFGLLYPHLSANSEELFQKLLRRPGVKSVEVFSDAIEVAVFARWLAKISYSYAVACLGYDEICHSPLRSMIRNGTLFFGHLVGGMNELRLPSQEFRLDARTSEFFSIELKDYPASDGNIYWATRVRIMPMLQTPTYFVIVGQRRLPTVEPQRLVQAHHR